jgi:hypothetical protein
MLDLQKLENEINSFIAIETEESYNELFKKMDFLEFVEKVKASGGYTNQFTCLSKIGVNKANYIVGNDDFADQNLNQAA